MRFRVPNNGGQQAADGVGNFFRSLAMAPMAEAQAADAAQQEQAKRSLIGAHTEQANANTRLIGAKAANEADLTQRRGLSGMIADAAMANGVAPYQVPDFVKYAQTGQMPSRYSPPPVDGVGPYEPAPAIYQDGTASKIWKMLGLNNQTLAFGRGDVSNVASATGAYQDQGAMDQAMTAANSGDYMKSSALSAVRGKKEFTPFKEVGTTGTALNQITGAQQVSNPALNFLFDQQGRSLIGRNDAAAGASKASAESSHANAAKTRQEMAMGEKGTLQQTDQGRALVNPRTGTAKLATGPGGKPFGNSVAAGYTKMTEGQAKANLFGQRMAGSNQILDDLAAKGVSMPSQIKRGADAVPLIGTGLGMIANKIAASPEQQQVEQAQRDFVNAVLRRESGAVISDGEFANAAQQYFPQPGDAPAVIEQKRRNRQRATELMLMEVPDAVRARSAALQDPAPIQPQAGSGYTGSWGAPSGPPRNVTVEY